MNSTSFPTPSFVQGHRPMKTLHDGTRRSARSLKRTLTLSAVVAMALCGAIDAQAANHYIRAGSTGAQTGNDWSSAWPALPSTLVRGDTYYIADGTYSGRTFSTAAS